MYIFRNSFNPHTTYLFMYVQRRTRHRAVVFVYIFSRRRTKMELQYLRNILEDLRHRFGLKYSPNEVSLKRQLLVLNSMEKQLIRKKVLGKIEGHVK